MEKRHRGGYEPGKYVCLQINNCGVKSLGAARREKVFRSKISEMISAIIRIFPPKCSFFLYQLYHFIIRAPSISYN